MNIAPPLSAQDTLTRAIDLLRRADFRSALETAAGACELGLAEGQATVAIQAAMTAAKCGLNQRLVEVGELWAQRVISIAAESPGRHAGPVAVAHVMLADVAIMGGRFDVGVQRLRQCVLALDQDMSNDDKMSCLTGLGMLYCKFGLRMQSLAAYRLAMTYLEADSHLGLRFRLHCNLLEGMCDAADVLLVVDRPQAEALFVEAESLLQATGDLAAAMGTAHAHAWHVYLDARLTLLRGGAQQALERLRHGAVDGAAVGMPLQLDLVLLEARALRRLGQKDAARALARGALPLMPRADAIHVFAEAQLWADLAEAQGDVAARQRWTDWQHATLVVRTQQWLDGHLAETAVQVEARALSVEVNLLRDRNAGLQHHQRELHTLAHHDPLTGLLNRRALQDVYSRMVTTGGAHRLLMLDVDHFKAVNDRYGHGVGDAVLRAIAELLHGVVREGDAVARFGGEEFVVLFDALCDTGAQAVVQRLQARLRTHAWHAVGVDHPVTVSGGLVLVREGDTLADTAQRADALLYAAKQAGRDQIGIEPHAP